MKTGSLASLICILICTASCTKVESELYVDDALLPFFESFVEEGAKRGVYVDFSDTGVEGFISDITQDGVVGQCSHSEDSPNKVTVDPVFWRQASYSRKEFVIFHELGHCHLQRSHFDGVDASGNCLSIMQSSADVCNSTYETNRDAYLDELFSN